MKNYVSTIKEKYSFTYIARLVSIITFFGFMIDVNNIPSKYVIRQSLMGNAVLLLLLLIFVIATISELKIFNLFFVRSINTFDMWLFVVLLSSIMYLGSIYVVDAISIYKYITVLIVDILTLTIILFRAVLHSRATKIDNEFKSNVYDLKEIYEGTFEISENKTILLSEREVDYDLLQRDSIIDKMLKSIVLSKPEGRFVISLEGKWGSGKTTILKNVKKQLVAIDENIVIIDEFDPWTYSDRESLFVNMFDTILTKTGYKYSTQNINRTIRKFSETIFGEKKWFFTKGFNEDRDINILKSEINDYLRLSKKKVVFFIDNIDRIDSQNVILLFKSVSNLLDFERITYVLSFDNDRVKSIFDSELGLDYQYLKKIIQMQIRVPEMDSNILKNVYKTCIQNILKVYGEDNSDMSSYELLVDNLCKQSLDIRDFKRFINSVISLPFSTNNYLCKKDLLVIEYIKLHNLTLYDRILSNRRYFIVCDKEYDRDLFADSFSQESFSNEVKEFFVDLFSDNEQVDYIDLLATSFPYIESYKRGSSIELQSFDYNSIAKEHRICSAKYFDLYFTRTSNDFLVIGKLTKELIQSLNNVKLYDERVKSIDKKMSLMDASYHKEFLERLQVHLEDIERDGLFDLSRILFDRIHTTDHSAAFLALAAQQRSIVIISEILRKMSDDDFDCFLQQTMKGYNNINLISTIAYWVEPNKGLISYEKRVDAINEICNKLVDEILEKNIDIYEDEYYVPNNIWALYRSKEDNPEVIKGYIKRIMNKDNIFKIIYDIIGLSHGTNYTYSISETNLEMLTSNQDLNSILEITKPITEDQVFVLDVYKKYLVDGSDALHGGGITVGIERKFNEL